LPSLIRWFERKNILDGWCHADAGYHKRAGLHYIAVSIAAIAGAGFAILIQVEKILNDSRVTNLGYLARAMMQAQKETLRADCARVAMLRGRGLRRSRLVSLTMRTFQQRRAPMPGSSAQ